MILEANRYAHAQSSRQFSRGLEHAQFARDPGLAPPSPGLELAPPAPRLSRDLALEHAPPFRVPEPPESSVCVCVCVCVCECV